MTVEPEPECRRACLRCGGLVSFQRSAAMSWVLLQEAGEGARYSCSSAWRQPCATRPDSFMCQSRGTLFRSGLASDNMGLTNINAPFPLRETRFLETQGCLGWVLLWLMSAWTVEVKRQIVLDETICWPFLVCYRWNMHKTIYLYIKLYISLW